MAVQFAGSGSTADRRRRRLAVGADTNVDAAVPEGDGGDIESQLVASEAAAPWVPVTELRIWIYAVAISLFLGAMTFVLLHPLQLPASVSPIAEHFLGGTRPMAVVFVETLLLALSTQMAALICWYRARCKIDFGGRYRVWPWAVGLIGMGAFCSATNIHLALGEVLGRSPWLPWRGSTVAWLLPFCVAALPMAVLVDRDVRTSRSSLWVLRFSGMLWLAASLLEIYRLEMQSIKWFNFAHQMASVYASAALFVGLWLHARIVAYVCPDPPELEERSAWSLAKSAFIWIVCRLLFRKWTGVATDAADEEEKPKRRRKKADGDETATRRKRRNPAKRSTSRTRSRPKANDEEETDDSNEAISDEEIESENQSDADFSSNSESADDVSDESSRNSILNSSTARVVSKTTDRMTQVHNSHGSAVPAPHSRHVASSWNNQDELEESENSPASLSDDPNNESDEDQEDSLDGRISSDQLKGLSKRQKRDLRKQMRDQQRARGR